MALTRTTLASAVVASGSSAGIQNQITVASATGFAAGYLVRIDSEMMKVQDSYVSGVNIPVFRGIDGTPQEAHVTTAGVVVGTAADFDAPAATTDVSYQLQRATVIRSITATGTLDYSTFPAGCDMRLILNGTSVITLTIPVPTVEMDGCFLTIIGNGAAAHVPTFTGGLSGAGGGYTTVTANGTKPVATTYVAVNAVWEALAQVPLAGTVTNITATVA